MAALSEHPRPLLTVEDLEVRFGQVPSVLPRYEIPYVGTRFRPEDVDTWLRGEPFPPRPAVVREPEPEPEPPKEPTPPSEFARHAPWMRVEGFVYWIADDDESPVKIGWSTTRKGIAQRLGGIQTGCWVPLRVHAVLEGQRWEEQHVHNELAEHRIRGEWFERGPALEYAFYRELLIEPEVGGSPSVSALPRRTDDAS